MISQSKLKTLFLLFSLIALFIFTHTFFHFSSPLATFVLPSSQGFSGKLKYTHFLSHVILLINITYGTMIYDMIANFSQAEEQIMSSDSVLPLLETPIIVSIITTILILIMILLNSIYECVLCLFGRWGLVGLGWIFWQ